MARKASFIVSAVLAAGLFSAAIKADSWIEVADSEYAYWCAPDYTSTCHNWYWSAVASGADYQHANASTPEEAEAWWELYTYAMSRWGYGGGC